MKYLDKMVALTTNLNESKNKNKTKFDKLKSSAESIKSNWKGEAASSFIKRFNDVTSSFDNYTSALDSYIKYLNTLDEEMTDLQQKNRNLFQ